MINDWLLIGIKDDKWSVIAQTGEASIVHAAKMIKKRLIKDGGKPIFDKYIIVQGAILNIL